MEQYVHQIGRASSVGEEGMAIVFINEDDKQLFKELIQNLKSIGAAIPREPTNSHYSLNTYQYSKPRKRGNLVHKYEISINISLLLFSGKEMIVRETGFLHQCIYLKFLRDKCTKFFFHEMFEDFCDILSTIVGSVSISLEPNAATAREYA